MTSLPAPRALSNATEIFGLHRPGVRGKTVGRKPDRFITDRIRIPRDFQHFQKSVTFVADVFFVSAIPFLIALSWKIKFVTVEHIRTQTATQLSNSLAKVCRLYGRASYNVKVILLDMEFEPVETIMHEDHAGETEHDIRVIKERGRSTITTLPFKKCPRRVIIELVYFIVL